MMPKKRPASKRKKVKRFEFDVNQTLLKNRQLFLMDHIDDDTVKPIIKQIYALATINNNPIHLYVNSCGGSCTSGLALIDAMRTVQAPIVTIISNEVCSMGGHISIAGDKRVCYENSVFMAHDLSTYFEDYSLRLKDRASFMEKYYQLLENNLRKHTELSEKDLRKARGGELWMFADEMLQKGVVDEIILDKE